MSEICSLCGGIEEDEMSMLLHLHSKHTEEMSRFWDSIEGPDGR